MYNTLTIVSDTAIYFDNGKYYGFAPVVREINHFENQFKKITWIGFNRIDKRNDSDMQEITSDKVRIVLLNKLGGKSFINVLKILLNYPISFFIILKNIYRADVIHTRAPSHPAFLGTLLSFLFYKKIWWHKFAGSWDANELAVFYKFQKKILEKAIHSKVTINGFWDNQPKHCLSFENPCLDENDILKGKQIANKKTFHRPFTFVFIGRLEPAKGMDRIVNALKEIPIEFIDKIHFIGDGNKTNFYKNECLFLADKVIFHGFLNKDSVHEILETSHFLLLPSSSEGFPKVVAEAACYGCIPIVSNVGSIPHYINKNNGYVWDINKKIQFSEMVKIAINTSETELQKIKENCLMLAEKFTFANYNEKLQEQILN